MADSSITTLIFDVDDTLYDVSTGFTAHRNGVGAQGFMVKYLDFPDTQSAKLIRDEYFERYHATAKALTIAEREGRLPPPDPSKPVRSPRFDPQDLAEYWATSLDFGLLGEKNAQLCRDLQECKLLLVAFSNSPRKYVKRVLVELGLFDLFGEDRLFAVDDVLPHCKPEIEAFHKVFDKLGIEPEECVMIEDSMKNIRIAKSLNMKTVLVAGKGRSNRQKTADKDDNPSSSSAAADESEATKPGDAPDISDPAVDVYVETADELRSVLPGLWESPAVFETCKTP
jgi:putative hydrolase of the HAD superfamily